MKTNRRDALSLAKAGATDFLPKRPQTLEMKVRLRNLIRLGSAVRKLNDRADDLAGEVAAATRKLQERARRNSSCASRLRSNIATTTPASIRCASPNTAA